MTNSITLNMIVGPFYEPFLEAAVKSAITLVDRIIFVDTAPCDNVNRPVMELFEEATIIDSPRKKEKKFSYAEARELARKATDSDWVLRLDADEVLRPETLEELRNHTRVPSHNAVQVLFYHHVLHPDYFMYTENDPKNILLRTSEIHWTGNVHESPNVKGRVINATHLRYNHYGYVRGQEEVYKRLQFYKTLGGFPHNIDHIQPEQCLAGIENGLVHFNGEHPPVVVPKLREMYPDLGTDPLGKKESI